MSSDSEVGVFFFGLALGTVMSGAITCGISRDMFVTQTLDVTNPCTKETAIKAIKVADVNWVCLNGQWVKTVK